MTIAEIYQILDEISPFCDQESWDNSGLLLGSMDDKFSQIYTSLDCDSKMIAKIPSNSLLITHHPLIFKGLKKVDNKFPCNILCEMIKKEIFLISMHTNFDKHCLNRYFVTEILELEVDEIDEFIIYANVNMKFVDFVKLVAKKLNLSQIRAVKSHEFIKKVAICTGSGADLINKINADCFITGDLKYHTALECYENRLSLIDIGHFESERYFGECLAKLLQKKQITAIIQSSINPFNYYEGML